LEKRHGFWFCLIGQAKSSVFTASSRDNFPDMKKIILVQDYQVDRYLVEKIKECTGSACSLVPLDYFYPHLVLENPPALIVFDISGTGIEWVWRLEQLKNLSEDQGTQCPSVIVVSSSPSTDLERLVRAARVDFFLPRTFVDDSIDVALKQALQ
jgi:CheY-like chemotaxis protein